MSSDAGSVMGAGIGMIGSLAVLGVAAKVAQNTVKMVGSSGRRTSSRPRKTANYTAFSGSKRSSKKNSIWAY